MSNDTQTLIIQLLGKTYPIKCPAEKVAELQHAAIRLDKEMREVYNTNNQYGLDRVAIMAALNLSYELITRQGQAKLDPSDEQLQTLDSEIDAVLMQQEEL